MNLPTHPFPTRQRAGAVVDLGKDVTTHSGDNTGVNVIKFLGLPHLPDHGVRFPTPSGPIRHQCTIVPVQGMKE